jgi:predicted transcriptional regulator
MDAREESIIAFLGEHPNSSSKEVYEGIEEDISYATTKRLLARLTAQNLLVAKGQSKATRYALSPLQAVLHPIDMEAYFSREIDQRNIRSSYNFVLIRDVLSAGSIFTEAELAKLNSCQSKFRQNITELQDSEFRKEMDRLAIDLSWKSSQIEGNTYSLLETERLLKEKQTAAGKTREEATMLLNHKEAIDFVVENEDYLFPLTISKVEDIHSILIKDLAIDRNLRKRRVGISGTNYKPLDNEFQIAEALSDTCNLINAKESIFEKALLALALISYIQPFMDGNKRTARIVCNAILIKGHHCPISFRTVDSIDYKKAMLLFYEQNNISAIKQIFTDQFEFAVNTYF